MKQKHFWRGSFRTGIKVFAAMAILIGGPAALEAAAIAPATTALAVDGTGNLVPITNTLVIDLSKFTNFTAVLWTNPATGSSVRLTTNGSLVVNGLDFHFGGGQTNSGNTNSFGAGDGQTMATNSHSTALGPNIIASNNVEVVIEGIGLVVSGETNTVHVGTTNASMVFSNATGTIALNGTLVINGTPLPSAGNLTSGTAGVSITGGTGAINGAGTSIAIQTATGSQPGLLASADWNTFNGKQAASANLTGWAAVPTNAAAFTNQAGPMSATNAANTFSGSFTGDAGDGALTNFPSWSQSISDRAGWRAVNELMSQTNGNSGGLAYWSSAWRLPNGNIGLYYSFWTNGFNAAPNQSAVKLKQGATWDAIAAAAPVDVLRASGTQAYVVGRPEFAENGTNWMPYFSGTAQGFETFTGMTLNLAYSTDGISWVNGPNNPILTLSNGTWHATAQYSGPMFKYGGNYFIAPAGFDNSTNFETTGLIMSTNGPAGPYVDVSGGKSILPPTYYTSATGGCNDLISMRENRDGSWTGWGRYVTNDSNGSYLESWTARTPTNLWTNQRSNSLADNTGALYLDNSSLSGVFDVWVTDDNGPLMLASGEEYNHGGIFLLRPDSLVPMTGDFTNLTVSNLTPGALVWVDASNHLETVSSLTGLTFGSGALGTNGGVSAAAEPVFTAGPGLTLAAGVLGTNGGGGTVTGVTGPPGTSSSTNAGIITQGYLGTFVGTTNTTNINLSGGTNTWYLPMFGQSLTYFVSNGVVGVNYTLCLGITNSCTYTFNVPSGYGLKGTAGLHTNQPATNAVSVVPFFLYVDDMGVTNYDFNWLDNQK